MSNTWKLEEEIKRLEAELVAARKVEAVKAAEIKRASFEAETPARYLATMLHHCECHHNHTDGCSWHYDTSWDDHAHEKYLEKALRLLEVLPWEYQESEKIHDIVNALAGYDVKERLTEINARIKKNTGQLTPR